MSKLISKSSIVLVILLMMTSCSFNPESYLNKFSSFITEVETKCPDYKQEDWKKSEEKFEKLLSVYKENEAKFSTEQKLQVAKLAGKYRAIQLKWGIKYLKDNVNDFIDKIYQPTE